MQEICRWGGRCGSGCLNRCERGCGSNRFVDAEAYADAIFLEADAATESGADAKADEKYNVDADADDL